MISKKRCTFRRVSGRYMKLCKFPLEIRINHLKNIKGQPRHQQTAVMASSSWFHQATLWEVLMCMRSTWQMCSWWSWCPNSGPVNIVNNTEPRNEIPYVLQRHIFLVLLGWSNFPAPRFQSSRCSLGCLIERLELKIKQFQMWTWMNMFGFRYFSWQEF